MRRSMLVTTCSTPSIYTPDVKGSGVPIMVCPMISSILVGLGVCASVILDLIAGAN